MKKKIIAAFLMICLLLGAVISPLGNPPIAMAASSGDSKPKGTSITKVTAKENGFVVTWKKQTSGTNGYEIQYATSSKFKKDVQTVTVDDNKTTSITIENLKDYTNYYVRVRTYKIAKTEGSNKKIYSDWSGTRKIQTRKAPDLSIVSGDYKYLENTDGTIAITGYTGKEKILLFRICWMEKR